jgi:hypothetical protein|tara:strand:+ start:606 stop:968 length:363 start_codon:yes stop_codon:yes gene_type:complete
MIHFFISGLQGNQTRVEKFCADVMYHYFKNRLKRTVDIEIRFVKELNAHGYCWGDKDYVVIEVAKKKNNTKYTKDEMVLTLTHELIHAKQFIRNEFVKKPQSLSETEAYNDEQRLFDLYW